MTGVTDLSHFIDETGSLPTNVPGPARRLMAHQTRIVAAATAAADDHDLTTREVQCRRRLGRRPCPGVIEHRLWPDERVRWQCPRCGDNGIISNWQSTAWDRRQVQPVH